MQFRLLENKARPKWEISRWTYSPEKKRAIKETLGSFPCYYSMVSHDILDKCTTQEKAEVLEWYGLRHIAFNPDEAMNDEQLSAFARRLCDELHADPEHLTLVIHQKDGSTHGHPSGRPSHRQKSSSLTPYRARPSRSAWL